MRTARIPAAYLSFETFEIAGKSVLSGVLSAYSATEAGSRNIVRAKRRTALREPNALDIVDVRAQFGGPHARFALILLFSRQAAEVAPKVERLVIFELTDARAEHSWNEADGTTELLVVPSASPRWLRLRFRLSAPRGERPLEASINATLRDVGTAGELGARH